MNQRSSPRLWAILGVGVAVVVGLSLLLVFLGREPGKPAPMITPAIPAPSDNAVVASIDGRPIHHAAWMEAVLLDHVMSGLSGQPAPTPEETLQRLINEELVLQAYPPERAPTAEQIEARIATLEQAWGIDDSAVVTALEKSRLTRATLERTVGRLLTVEAGLEALQSQGTDETVWLEEQRASANIVIDETLVDTSVPYVPVAQSPIETTDASPLATPDTSPIPTPTPDGSVLSPIPAPATQPPLPTPAPVIPEFAADFTLEQAGGGTLTLSEQLAQGPVVLVFFHRYG